MTYEKHKLTTDALDTLGSIIDEGEKRDAIHLAVEPVVAANQLGPGEHVKFDNNGRAQRARPGQGIGIVDPFLTQPVKVGERFWLVVYPRQISSLRHVWEHPAFPPSGETEQLASDDANLVEHNSGQDVRATHEAWLRSWHASSDIKNVAFDDLIEAIETGAGGPPLSEWYRARLICDEYGLISQGTDASGDIPAEFWVHAEAYVGHPLRVRPSYLGCNC